MKLKNLEDFLKFSENFPDDQISVALSSLLVSTLLTTEKTIFLGWDFGTCYKFDDEKDALVNISSGELRTIADNFLNEPIYSLSLSRSLAHVIPVNPNDPNTTYKCSEDFIECSYSTSTRPGHGIIFGKQEDGSWKLHSDFIT